MDGGCVLRDVNYFVVIITINFPSTPFLGSFDFIITKTIDNCMCFPFHYYVQHEIKYFSFFLLIFFIAILVAVDGTFNTSQISCSEISNQSTSQFAIGRLEGRCQSGRSVRIDRVAELVEQIRRSFELND